MSNKMIVTVDPSKAARKTKDIDQGKEDKFLEVVQRAYSKKPTPTDLRELKRWLSDYPDLWRGVFDLAEIIMTNFIERMAPEEAARITLGQNVSSIKDDLGYGTAPSLEKLLIDSIVIAWLRNQWAEYQMVTLMGNGEIRMSVVEFWERRLSASQRRYLLACQTLAKIRRLSSKNPALQVNIATQSGQQVNVAGGLLKNS